MGKDVPQFMTDNVIAQLSALRCESGLFYLRLIKFLPDGGKITPLYRNLSVQDIVDRLSYLRWKNSDGFNINVCPQGNRFSMIDDLTTERIDWMEASGYEPCVVVETSVGNYQAWLNHGRTLSDDEASDFAKQLTALCEGDHGAAGRNHSGRLAGFSNRKESRRLPDGRFFFTKLRLAKDRAFSNAAALVCTPSPLVQPSTARNSHESVRPGKSLLSIEWFHSRDRYRDCNGNPDLSRADAGYATYALSHGVSRSEIVREILKRDMTAKKGRPAAQKKYAEHTVDSAIVLLRKLGK